MVRYFKSILSISLTLAACSDHQTNKTSTEQDTKTEIQIRDTISKNDDFYSNSFLIFWKDFRTSIISHDTLRINKNINLPFDVHGFEDNDPKYQLRNNDSIFRVLNSFLRDSTAYCDGDGAIDHITLIQKAENIHDLSNCDFQLDSIYCRIGQMIFSYEGDKWYFSGIYLKTRNRNFWKNQ